MATTSLTGTDSPTRPRERIVTFADTPHLNRLLIDLCGEFDRNLAQIEHQLSVQIMRRGNVLAVYGEVDAQAKAESVLHSLFQRAEIGKPIEPGDIDGLIRLMNSDDGIGGPVNLGNPREFTVLELAEMVLDKTGSPSRLRFLDALQDDPKQRRPDITLAHTLLGWQPTVSLHDGLDRMIAHFAQAPQQPCTAALS